MAQVVPTILSDITPKAFRDLVANLGFASTLDLAGFVGARDDTVRRWLNGKKSVPRSVAMLLALMLAEGYSVDDVLHITREGSRS